MKVTNTHGLPETIVRAVSRDDYSRGPADISVTQLISPPRAVALIEAHKDEIVEDASNLIWRLLGKAVHKVLADAGEDALTEERLFIHVLGWIVSGQFDSLTLRERSIGGWHLRDWKVTSARAVQEGVKPEWEAQLNLDSYLLAEAGFEVASLSIGAILRDWSALQAERDTAGYPQQAAVELSVRLWPVQDQRSYLKGRVQLHMQARLSLPECTPEERWEQPAVYAVTKEGRKSALRLLETREEAEGWIAANRKPGERLETQARQGKWARCERYCQAAPFCSQWQEYEEKP